MAEVKQWVSREDLSDAVEKLTGLVPDQVTEMHIVPGRITVISREKSSDGWRKSAHVVLMDLPST